MSSAGASGKSKAKFNRPGKDARSSSNRSSADLFKAFWRSPSDDGDDDRDDDDRNDDVDRDDAAAAADDGRNRDNIISICMYTSLYDIYYQL